MISRWDRLEKYLNYFLVFLLPTQLAQHFWPSFAFVFGTRVDYLAPSLYLTDILFLVIFLPWAVGSYKKIFRFIWKYRNYILPFFLLAILNTIFSSSIFPTIYKWIKLSELIAFGFYVCARPEIFRSKAFFTTLFYSLVFFSVIGILQFIFGGTLGGPLYCLGERSFNISTPGIALVTILGRIFMRAYSTFSHPNSLAGYLGAGMLLLLSSFSKRDFVKKLPGIIIVCLGLVLTFSLSGLVAIAACTLVYILVRRKLINKKNLILVPTAIFLISLGLPFLSKIAIQSKINLPQNIGQRLEMSLVAGKFISQKFFIGEGLNTFVINGAKSGYLGYYLWLLQPVHNTVLLIFSEVGVFGALLFYLLMVKSFRRAWSLNNVAFLLALTFVLTTGLFDHYWFTLQQNMLLFALILGNL